MPFDNSTSQTVAAPKSAVVTWPADKLLIIPGRNGEEDRILPMSEALPLFIELKRLAAEFEDVKKALKEEVDLANSDKIRCGENVIVVKHKRGSVGKEITSDMVGTMLPGRAASTSLEIV